jgi:hypothetical protein
MPLSEEDKKEIERLRESFLSQGHFPSVSEMFQTAILMLPNDQGGYNKQFSHAAKLALNLWSICRDEREKSLNSLARIFHS